MGLEQLEFSVLYFFQSLRTPFFDEAVPAFTSLGNKGWFFVVLGLVLFAFKRSRRAGAAVLLSLLGGFLIGNVALKNLTMRDRPCWLDPSVQLLITSPKDYSFPSGHTLAAFETAVSIFFASRRWGIFMLFFAAAMGLSRLYLFVHFPTDVLSGMALGIFIAWFVHRILEKFKNCAILRT